MMQQQIQKLLAMAIANLQHQKKLPIAIDFLIKVEPTKNEDHGDFASNIAMMLAKPLQCKPLEAAEIIAAALPQHPQLNKVEIAKPGFINFYLNDSAFHQIVAEISEKQDRFGHSNIGQGKSVIVEFVSSNPTGPLHVGHGRGAAFGATISDLLKAIGYQVHREYYVNDAGRQMQVLTVSIWLRYLEINRSLPHFPTGGYRGEYIIDIARRLQTLHGEQFHRSLELVYQDLPADENEGGNKDFYIDALVERAKSLLGEKDFEIIFAAGLETIMADIHEDLEEFGVIFEEWFSESHLVKKSRCRERY